MTDTFTVYRKYPSAEHAQGIVDLLEANQIEYSIEKTAPLFDVTFAQNQQSEEIVIKLKATDFKKADGFLEQMADETYKTIENDHYLFNFTDQELMDVVVKPYEWNAFDYQLAQKILKDRGKEVNIEVVNAIKKKNLEEMTQTEAAPTAWIWAGYLLSLMGGLLGFFIGWHLMSHSKVLPTGEKKKAFDANTRKHGERIMIVGGICIIVWLLIRLNLSLFN